MSASNGIYTWQVSDNFTDVFYSDVNNVKQGWRIYFEKWHKLEPYTRKEIRQTNANLEIYTTAPVKLSIHFFPMAIQRIQQNADGSIIFYEPYVGSSTDAGLIALDKVLANIFDTSVWQTYDGYALSANKKPVIVSNMTAKDGFSLPNLPNFNPAGFEIPQGVFPYGTTMFRKQSIFIGGTETNVYCFIGKDLVTVDLNVDVADNFIRNITNIYDSTTHQFLQQTIEWTIVDPSFGEFEVGAISYPTVGLPLIYADVKQRSSSATTDTRNQMYGNMLYFVIGASTWGDET